MFYTYQLRLSCLPIDTKLTPVNGVEKIECETKLVVLIGFYLLDKSIEAHVEQQEAQAIAL